MNNNNENIVKKILSQDFLQGISTTSKVLLAFIFSYIAFSLLNINFNGAYMDEADYLFISKVLFSGRTWVTQTYVFSSDIPFYLLGIGEKLAGLLGARVISLIFGGFSITAFYFFVRDLLEDKKVALFSTLFLASQASFIFLSKFATYDIFCFCFFMLSLWSGVRFYKQDKLSWGIFSAVAFVLAVLCKYVVIIYLPFIGGLFLLAKGKKALPLVGVVATLLLSYFLIYKTDLTILYKTQIVGSHKSNSSEFEIWKIFFKYMLLPLVIVFSGKVLKSLEGIKKNYFWFLLVLALPIFMYHLKNHDMISLYKHMLYPVMFVSPLMGIYLSNLVGRNEKKHRSFLIFLSLLIVGVSSKQLYDMEHAYPNTKVAVDKLNSVIVSENSLLSEDSYLFRYHFHKKLRNSHIFETAVFDNDADNKYEDKDVIDAVWEGKFDYIYLNGLIKPDLTSILKEKVLHNAYDLFYEEAFNVSNTMSGKTEGKLEIYKARKKYSGQWSVIKNEND